MILSIAIPATTHVDRHHERFALSALEGMAVQINSKYIPFRIEHNEDWEIGVSLCAVVKPLFGGHFALVVVYGRFESSEEALKYSKNQINRVHSKYMKLIRDLDLSDYKSIQSTPAAKKPQNLADWLELHLDSTKVSKDGRVYKVKHFIASTGDLSIHVYPKDHNPPHFHVLSKQRGIDARFHISTLEHLSDKRGRILKKDIKKIQNFFAQNSHFLVSLRSEYDRLQTD